MTIPPIVDVPAFPGTPDAIDDRIILLGDKINVVHTVLRSVQSRIDALEAGGGGGTGIDIPITAAQEQLFTTVPRKGFAVLVGPTAEFIVIRQ